MLLRLLTLCKLGELVIDFSHESFVRNNEPFVSALTNEFEIVIDPDGKYQSFPVNLNKLTFTANVCADGGGSKVSDID